MPTKPLDRLLFAQGGRCFFCESHLQKDVASVEHLVASARNGHNGDDNCVVCCKAMNALLGSMSLKEKIKVVLNQKGRFKCPNGAGNGTQPQKPTPKAAAQAAPPKPAQSAPPAPKPPATPPTDEVLAAVIANLKGRGKSRPRKLKTLTSTIKSLPLDLSDAAVKAVIQQLRSKGNVTVSGVEVTYKL
jgi:hypothetical protein